jgi:hypothetical protein
MVFLYGRVEGDLVKDNEVIAIGNVKLAGSISEGLLVIVGRGRVGLTSGRECIFVSSGGPLLVDTAYCVNTIALGGRSPVGIGRLRGVNLYARRAYIFMLDVESGVFGELCTVEEVIRLKKASFIDPHMYFKKLNLDKIESLSFTYRVIDTVDSLAQL